MPRRAVEAQVSVMARELNVDVQRFRTRRLDPAPYTLVAVAALVLKVRDSAGVSVHVLLASGSYTIPAQISGLA